MFAPASLPSQLPWSVQWQDLKDYARSAGVEATRTEIAEDSERRSKGFGVVTVATEADAHKVIQYLNGADLDGRILEARMDHA